MSAATEEVRGWLADELAHAGPRRKAQLAKLAAHLKRAEQHQHANTLPVGSFQRQLAQRHERKMVSEAMNLGFHAKDEEIKELALHVAGHSLGLSL